MPSALLRFGQLSLMVALLAACGSHWLVLQTVAWTGMIVEYSRTASLTVAMKETFDGQHPCGLCQRIDSGKKKESRQDVSVQFIKLQFVLFATVTLQVPERRLPPLRFVHSSREARVVEPLLRPPQTA